MKDLIKFVLATLVFAFGFYAGWGVSHKIDSLGQEARRETTWNKKVAEYMRPAFSNYKGFYDSDEDKIFYLKDNRWFQIEFYEIAKILDDAKEIK